MSDRDQAEGEMPNEVKDAGRDAQQGQRRCARQPGQRSCARQPGQRRCARTAEVKEALITKQHRKLEAKS